jgi:hypothetical protein
MGARCRRSRGWPVGRKHKVLAGTLARAAHGTVTLQKDGALCSMVITLQLPKCGNAHQFIRRPRVQANQGCGGLYGREQLHRRQLSCQQLQPASDRGWHSRAELSRCAGGHVDTCSSAGLPAQRLPWTARSAAPAPASGWLAASPGRPVPAGVDTKLSFLLLQAESHRETRLQWTC